MDRKTSKMIERDLMAARDKWLDEAKDYPDELQRRLRTDFLCQCNHDGLYADFDDKSSLISALTLDQVEEMIEFENLTSGMIPKVGACARALRAGVPRAHILNGTVPHALLLEVYTDEGVGTMMGFIRTMAEDCIRRDRGVLGMVERSAALDPDAAIVVPRGSGHRGMVALLEGSPHRVHVAERLDCEDFMDRAVRISYGRALGDDELRAYAVLELELMKFVHARMESLAFRAAGMIGAARWLRRRLVREGMAMLDADIAGGRFELPVPGL